MLDEEAAGRRDDHCELQTAVTAKTLEAGDDLDSAGRGELLKSTDR
jgi:hypothetical protein